MFQISIQFVLDYLTSHLIYFNLTKFFPTTTLHMFKAFQYLDSIFYSQFRLISFKKLIFIQYLPPISLLATTTFPQVQINHQSLFKSLIQALKLAFKILF